MNCILPGPRASRGGVGTQERGRATHNAELRVVSLSPTECQVFHRQQYFVPAVVVIVMVAAAAPEVELAAERVGAACSVHVVV